MAKTITPGMVSWLRVLIATHRDVMDGEDDPDPSATLEMLTAADMLYAALAEEMKRNGLDARVGFGNEVEMDVLLVPHEAYDLDCLQEYAESVASVRYTTTDDDDAA